MLQQYIEAAKIVTTHGIRGEMKIEYWCEDDVFLRQFKTLYMTKTGQKPVKVQSVRPIGRMGLLKLAGVEDMDAARALVGTVLYFDRRDARLPKDTWFYQDLIGIEVRDADTGRVYGTVKSVDHPGPQDIYTVAGADGKEYRFPGVDAFLKELNPVEGYLRVAPIPGMFDDASYNDLPPQPNAKKEN